MDLALRDLERSVVQLRRRVAECELGELDQGLDLLDVCGRRVRVLVAQLAAAERELELREGVALAWRES